MMIGLRQWGIALALSLAAHLAAAGLLETGEVPAEAGSGAQVMLVDVGDAFADAAAAGEPFDVADPVAQADGLAEPVETQTLAASDADIVEADAAEVERPLPAEIAEPVRELVETAAADVPAVTSPAEIPPVDADAVEAMEAPAADAPQAAHVEPPVPTEPVAIAAVTTVADVQVAAAVPTLETVEAFESVPVPVAKPKNAPKTRVAQAKPAPQAKAAPQAVKKKAPARTAPAKAAQSKKAAPPKTAGAATGKASTKKAVPSGNGASGKQKQSAQKGGGKSEKVSGKDRAAVTNYPGKVAGKLRRSWRYPRSLRGKASRGEVLVSFTVAANGSASGVHVARSSGSSDLDRAAMDAVRRAAPFPPIPSAAGRRSWAFTVPLAVR